MDNFVQPQPELNAFSKKKKVLLSTLLVAGILMMFVGGFNSFFRGALIPFLGLSENKIKISQYDLSGDLKDLGTFENTSPYWFGTASSKEKPVVFGSKFNDWQDVKFSVFELVKPGSGNRGTARDTQVIKLDPRVPHKFKVEMLGNLSANQKQDVIAMVVDADAFKKLQSEVLLEETSGLCTEEADTFNCYEFLEQLAKNTDLVRMFNLSAENPSHELIIPRYLTPETKVELTSNFQIQQNGLQVQRTLSQEQSAVSTSTNTEVTSTPTSQIQGALNQIQQGNLRQTDPLTPPETPLEDPIEQAPADELIMPQKDQPLVDIPKGNSLITEVLATEEDTPTRQIKPKMLVVLNTSDKFITNYLLSLFQYEADTLNYCPANLFSSVNSGDSSTAEDAMFSRTVQVKLDTQGVEAEKLSYQFTGTCTSVNQTCENTISLNLFENKLNKNKTGDITLELSPNSDAGFFAGQTNYTIDRNALYQKKPQYFSLEVTNNTNKTPFTATVTDGPLLVGQPAKTYPGTIIEDADQLFYYSHSRLESCDSPNEGSCLRSYQVALKNKPTTNVYLRAVPSSPEVSTVDENDTTRPVDMVFTPVNFDEPQSVYLKVPSTISSYNVSHVIEISPVEAGSLFDFFRDSIDQANDNLQATPRSLNANLLSFNFEEETEPLVATSSSSHGQTSADESTDIKQLLSVSIDSFYQDGNDPKLANTKVLFSDYYNNFITDGLKFAYLPVLQDQNACNATLPTLKSSYQSKKVVYEPAIKYLQDYNSESYNKETSITYNPALTEAQRRLKEISIDAEITAILARARDGDSTIQIKQLAASLQNKLNQYQKIVEFCEAKNINEKATILASDFKAQFTEYLSAIYAPTQSMPNGARVMAPPVEISANQLNELKTEAESKDVDFIVLNNKMSYGTYNKALFSMLGLVEGYELNGGSFGIETFLNPQPNLFDTETFANTLVSVFGRTNLLALSYANLEEPDYINLFSTYPSTKKPLTEKLLTALTGSGIYLSDYLSYESQLSESESGLLVYLATEKENRPAPAEGAVPNSCNAFTVKFEEDVKYQMYILPYKLVAQKEATVETPTEEEPGDEPGEETPTSTLKPDPVAPSAPRAPSGGGTSSGGGGGGSGGSLAQCQRRFSDFTQYGQSIATKACDLYQKNIFLGKPNPNAPGQFLIAANDLTIRAEGFAILSRVSSLESTPVNISLLSKFPDLIPALRDLNKNSWFLSPLTALVQNGTARGYADGTIKAAATMTQPELAKVIAELVVKSNQRAFKNDDTKNPWYTDTTNLYQSLQFAVQNVPANRGFLIEVVHLSLQKEGRL